MGAKLWQMLKNREWIVKTVWIIVGKFKDNNKWMGGLLKIIKAPNYQVKEILLHH